MKKIIFLFMILFSVISFGQVKKEKFNKIKGTDSLIINSQFTGPETDAAVLKARDSMLVAADTTSKIAMQWELDGKPDDADTTAFRTFSNSRYAYKNFMNAADGDPDSAIYVNTNGQVGIGTTAPSAPLEVVSSNFPVQKITRLNPGTSDVIWSSFAAKSKVTSRQMGDGFGAGIAFFVEDQDAVENMLASIGAMRSGVDNSGVLSVDLWSGGVKQTGVFNILPSGKVGIGTINPIKALDVNGGIRTNDTLRVGNYSVYSYIKAGDAAWTISSDSSLKTNIKKYSANLNNFKNIIPRSFNFKKDAFLKSFDETSMPDSIYIDSLGIKVSNKEEKDKKRLEFEEKNLAEANAQSKIVHTGFLADEFNKQLFNTNSKEIDYQDVIVTMWAKIQELEARIEVLEKK